MNDKKIDRIAIPLLPCTSIKETKDFYTAMGAVITYEQKAPNNYIGFKINDIEVHFFGMKQLKPEANFSTCYLIVDNVDAFYEHCRAGLKALYGKVPIKGMPRMNQVKDMPTYGVRQFIIVDPSGNYIRVGQPITKIASVLFEENGKKPEKATALTKAYELADRLANGKEDLEAAIAVIDKALASDDDTDVKTVFKLLVLRMDLAQRMDDTQNVSPLFEQATSLLSAIKDKQEISQDIEMFNRISAEMGLK